MFWGCGSTSPFPRAAAAGPPAPALSDAKPLAVETLGVPVKGLPYKYNFWAAHPDGQTWTRLLFYPRQGQLTQTVAIDLGSGSVRTIVRPELTGFPWRSCAGLDGKLYLGNYGSASIWIYDPATGALDAAHSGIKEVTTVSSVSCGADDKINCSTTPKVISFDYDPATGEFRDFGIQGQKPSYLGYGYTVGGDADYIYTAAGKIPWQLVACNKQTREQEVLLETVQDGYIQVRQGRYGATARMTAKLGDKSVPWQEFWLYKGEAIPRKEGDTPPWPEPEAVSEANPPKPEELLDDANAGADGRAVYAWRNRQDKDGWKSVEYELEVVEWPIASMREMRDGRILGTGPAYHDWFILDPATGKTQIFPKLHLSHYDTVVAPDGKIYLMGYLPRRRGIAAGTSTGGGSGETGQGIPPRPGRPDLDLDA